MKCSGNFVLVHYSIRSATTFKLLVEMYIWYMVPAYVHSTNSTLA